MKNVTVSQAAHLCGGKLINCKNPDTELTSVCIDSRLAGEGSMFAAFKGEKVDGHDYIAKAFSQGAACCLAERVPEDADGTVILVPNVETALKSFAQSYRAKFNIPVIGIAGSVGKTTAKEMVASVLAERFKVLKTEKNLNNELGVPLTLFRINPEHEAAVVEMGISDFGEMRRLAKMVRPTMAVYTLIGHAHLEHLHDRDGVLKAKTEMLEYMPADGTVFLNADDDKLASYECAQNRVLYGRGENAFVKAENISIDGVKSISCDIVCEDRRFRVSVPAYGQHMVYAALEGASVGIKMGLTDDEIIRGISHYETVGRRANIIDTGYITLIDDCYNANPDSVKCGIDSMPEGIGRKVCILGDMLEMGEDMEALHASVGTHAANSGAELLISCGARSVNTHRAAEKLITAVHFDTNAELIAKLPELINKGDVVLVKASNSMHFDDISEALKLLK